MTTFVQLFDSILTADKEESRKSAREVNKFLYSSRENSDKFEEIRNIVNSAPETYFEISEEEDWRKENFVRAISVIYFLHDKKKQPNFLFPWLLFLLSNENGNIRHASVRMIQHEISPLTYHVRFPGEKSDFAPVSPEQADWILFSLFVSLNRILINTWKPSYEKHKYISSLPSGTYKSAQLILDRLEYLCGEEYMKKTRDMLHQM